MSLLIPEMSKEDIFPESRCSVDRVQIRTDQTVRSSEDEGSIKSVEDLQELTTAEEHLVSPFNEPNIVLVFGKKKLYLQKEQLTDISPVFEAMFSSKLPVESMKEIHLPDKKLSHFVHFLRFLSPGFEDELTEATVHHMLPLAEEYQTDVFKFRIEKFLIRDVLFKSDLITSVQIIAKILEAEKYKLTGYLTACIDVASRKKSHRLTKTSEFEEISQTTQLKICFKRMKNIDRICNNAIPSGGMSRLNRLYMMNLGKYLKPYMKDN